MIKKTLIFLLMLFPLGMKAQQAAGSWKVFSSFSSIDDMLETPDKVYYLSSGSLYAYDKDNDESLTFTTDNYLTDTNISAIYYNPWQKYLAIVYATANVDLLYDSGKVVNIPDIRDASLGTTKTINDITFSKDGQMVISTSFGVVIYDDQKHQVLQSGIYNAEVSKSVMTDNYLFIYIKLNNQSSLYGVERNKRINNLSNFKSVSNWWIPLCMYPLNNDKVITIAGNNLIRIASFDTTDDSGWKATYTQISDPSIKSLNYYKNGYYGINNTLLTVDYDGNVETKTLSNSLSSQICTIWDDFNTVWAGDDNGIANYKVENGNLTILQDKYIPEALTLQKIGRIYCGNSGKTYLSEMGLTKLFESDWNVPSVAKINYLDNLIPHDTNIDNLTIYYPNVNTKTTRSIFGFTEEQQDPNVWYMASYNGITRIKDNKEIACFNYKNSAVLNVVTGGARETWAIGMDVDSNDNLWVLIYQSNGAGGVLNCLPHNKIVQGDSSITDWIVIPFQGKIGSSDGILRACKKSNMVFATYRYCHSLLVYDSKNKKQNVIESVVDQDGKEISMVLDFGAMVEDKNGQVWVGHSNGVFVITNPSEATNSVVRVNRVKVPRNDGTNYADYLLEGEFVLGIDVDAANRKWIATQNSGVYLVSADGSQILEHFTTSNSPLPDNKVYAVGCDKQSNAVYFGTTKGLVQYNSTAAPSQSDFSDVYAYPNPVRPEYSGWITIRGLMENSLVKIADAAGNVFFQGTSEGGMIMWDGCDSKGERVKTGVYYVFASQSNDTNSSGAVTKILVVK